MNENPVIPEELLPSDGRFGSGPSKVRPEAVRALAEAAPVYLGTSHRQQPVKSVVSRLKAGLAGLFSLPDGYEIALGVGGATVFWDALVFSFIDRRSQHVVFGEFSAKFARAVAAAEHLDDPDIVEAPLGAGADPRAAGVDVYALVHNETSTGVCRRIVRPDSTGLVAVDATSAAGGVRIDPADFDVYYFSPQKCFASEGGLWVALCSPAAIERIEQVVASRRYIPPSLDLKAALESSRMDQTLNTPALATLLLMAEQLDWMLERGGLEWAASRCERSSSILYGWAERSDFAQPFVEDPSERSPVVGTIDLDHRWDAPTVSRTLRANGILDTEPYRKLGRNQLRIGMYPAVEPDDVERLTRCIDHVVGTMAG